MFSSVYITALADTDTLKKNLPLKLPIIYEIDTFNYFFNNITTYLLFYQPSVFNTGNSGI